LTSLRLFVNKIFLGSCRAHCDCKKNTKVRSMSIYAKIRGILAILLQKSGDFDKSSFILRSVDFLELEYF